MSSLELAALDVRYGGVHAVRDLSFEVAPGEMVGLIGANGAGKSSTLHAIMGIAPVTGGDVRLGGESLLGCRPEEIARAGIALVPVGERRGGGPRVVGQAERLEQRVGTARRRARACADAQRGDLDVLAHGQRAEGVTVLERSRKPVPPAAVR